MLGLSPREIYPHLPLEVFPIALCIWLDRSPCPGIPVCSHACRAVARALSSPPETIVLTIPFATSAMFQDMDPPLLWCSCRSFPPKPPPLLFPHSLPGRFLGEWPPASQGFFLNKWRLNDFATSLLDMRCQDRAPSRPFAGEVLMSLCFLSPSSSFFLVSFNHG